METYDRLINAVKRREEQKAADKGIVSKSQEDAVKAMAEEVAEIAAARGMTVKEVEEAIKRKNNNK
jgi:hypothetical protein